MEKPAPLLFWVQGLITDTVLGKAHLSHGALSKDLESKIPGIVFHVFDTIETPSDGPDGTHAAACPDFHQRALDLLRFVDKKCGRKPLVSSVAGRDGSDDNSPPPLILAGHDLGGVLVKQALVASNSDPRWGWIAKSTIAALFFETPCHDATDRYAWERAIVQMMARATHKLDCISFLKYFPVCAIRIEEQFYGLREGPFQIVSFHEKSSPICPTAIESHTSHSEICKFSESGMGEAWSAKEDDAAAETLRRLQVLLSHRATSSSVEDIVSNSQELSHCLQDHMGKWQQLQSPLLATYTSSRFNEWISRGQWYENWTMKPAGSVLHIASPSGTGVNSFTSSIARKLREAGEMVFVFSMLAFSQQPQADVEMPGTLLFAALCRALLQRAVSDRAYGDSSYCWLLEDRVLTKNIAKGLLSSLLSSRDPRSRIFCIIHDLHTVSPEEKSRIAEDLDTVMTSSACTFKLLVATDDQASWKSADHETVRMDFREDQLEYLEVMRRFAITRLRSFAATRAAWRQGNPDLKSMAVDKICSESGTMFELSLKLDFMESITTVETISEMENMISQLPKSVEETIERTLRSRSDLESLALTALIWILSSLRSLSLSELSVCIALGTGPVEADVTSESMRSRISWDLSKDLSLALGPLVTVTGDRATIRHRTLRACLGNRTQSRTGSDSHLFLLQRCLEYLKLISGSWTLSLNDAADEDPERELLLAKYAAENWQDHAFLSLDQEKATNFIMDFVDSESFRTWLSMLQYYRSEPFCQIPESAVEAACSFGLLGVVKELLKRAVLTESVKEDFIVGLDRASEKGHLLVVDCILEEGIRSANAARIASRHGRTAVLESLARSYALDLVNNDDYGFGPLLEASRGGHCPTVDFLLEQGADVNAKTNEGLTPLHFACRIGHASVVDKLLISPEIDISPVDDQGYTPLMYASWAGFTAIVQRLATCPEKEGHSVVACCTKEGKTALHLAVSGGHTRVVELLLRLKADPEAVSKDFTSLHIAAKLGLLEITKLLIKASEKRRPHKEEGLKTRSALPDMAESPLGLAVANRHPEIIRELLGSQQHASPKTTFRAVSYACQIGYLNPVIEILRWHREQNAHTDSPAFLQSENGQTALHLAVEFGHQTLVTEILKENLVPIDARDRTGWTSLHTAAKRGDLLIVKSLLKNHANLASTTDNGKTALHTAAQHGRAEICKFLWKKASGSVRNAKTSNGLLPVSLAVENGHVEATKALLNLDREASHEGLLHLAVKRGSELLLDEVISVSPPVDWANNEEETAVHCAVSHGRIEMVQRLHKAKANMAAKDARGRTPLFRAVEKENVKMVEALIALGTELDEDAPNNENITPLLKICESESFWDGDPKPVIDIARLLLENYESSVNINVADPNNGKTPLHHSTDSDSDELTMILLRYKADPKIRNKNGSTPILLAAEMGKDESVKALLGAGAEASIQNYSNETPLHRAAGNGHANCIQTLMEFREDNNAKGVLNVKNEFGYTPLALAATDGFTECVKMLLGYKPDLTVENHEGLTPLGLAAEVGCEDSMEELLRAMEANPSDIAQTVREAAANDHADVVETLVNRLKKPNIRDEVHGSILGVAVAHQMEEVASVLLSMQGIETEHKDTAGRTPLLVAVQHGNHQLVEALTEAGAKPNTKDMEGSWSLFHAIMLKDEQIVQHLLHLDSIKLDEEDGRGYGNLYWACRANQDAIFSMVNDAVRGLPSYPSMRDAAIHACVASNNVQALKVLLAMDANCNTQGLDGWPALYTAKCYGLLDIEEALIAKGANPEADSVRSGKRPSRWHLEDKGAGLAVQEESQNSVQVSTTIKTPEGADTQTSIVRANWPLCGQEDWYFEIKINRGYQDHEQYFGIGIADDQASRGGRMLGFHSKNQSYGYHADDGQAYPSRSDREMDSETYEEGDVVGCGYIHDRKSLYFTRDGVYLGVAFKDVAGKFYPAVFMDTREVGIKLTARFDSEEWEFKPGSSPWAANGSLNEDGSEWSDNSSQADPVSSLHSQAESDDN